MTDTMQASNSEIATFKRCKRKWYLQYYRQLGLAREDQYGARAIGTRVHVCLDVYYKQQAEDFLAEDVVDVLELHDDLVNLTCEEYPEQAEDVVKDAKLSRIMLEGYFDWLEESGADEGLIVAGSEQEVKTTIVLPTNGVPVTVRGKLDLRVKREHDGALLFLDHKTVQEFTTPTKTLHLDEQMLMYDFLLVMQQLAAEDGVEPERVDGGIYNMIRKVKRTATSSPPFYMRFEIRHTREELRSFARRLVAVLTDIAEVRTRLDAGDSHENVCYPTPNRNCSWDCDFVAVCPLMNRPSDKPESFLEVAYTAVDPYKRYDTDDGGT